MSFIKNRRFSRKIKLCFSICHKIADEYFNIALFEGRSFTNNVGRAKNYYDFNCWLYYNKNDKKIDPENEVKTLNKLFDKFDLKKYGWEKFGICVVTNAVTWTGFEKAIIFSCIKPIKC